MFNTIPEIIEAIRQGEMVVMIDDEDRENEGDVIMAAQKVTPEHINFMIQHARGLLCLPMTEAKCQQLNLPQMVSANGTKYGTKFTVSIEAAEGVTTGISAHDRAKTILAAANPSAKSSDIVQPGHIFPIMAQPGGVLSRAGHTEAGCDLARLAGYDPIAVLIEILNSDGTMARRDALLEFAKTHQLKIGTIADLIRYRLEREATIEKVAEHSLETQYGIFKLHAFQDLIKNQIHLALVSGQPDPAVPAPVRVHVRDALYDLPGLESNQLETGRWPLDETMRYLAKRRSGALILLAHEESSIELMKRLQVSPLPKVQPSHNAEAVEEDWRLIGQGCQILSQLGYEKLEILSAEKKLSGLSAFNLEVMCYIPFSPESSSTDHLRKREYATN